MQISINTKGRRACGEAGGVAGGWWECRSAGVCVAEVEVDGSTRRGLGVNTPAVVVVGWASDRGKRRISAVR